MTRHMFHMKRKRREMRSPALPKGIEAAEKAERERGGVGARKADSDEERILRKAVYPQGKRRRGHWQENIVKVKTKDAKQKDLKRLRQRKQQSNITISNRNMTRKGGLCCFG